MVIYSHKAGDKMKQNLPPPPQIWAFMYKELFNFIQEWANTRAGARPMMAAAMRRMPDDMKQDRVSDFLIQKWSRMAQSEPLINDITTWKRDEEECFTNFKDYSAARFFVYKSFTNFCADEYRKMQRETSTDYKELNNMVEDTTIENAVETLTDIVEQLTNKESVIVLWRIGLLDRAQATEKLGCSQATLFRRYEIMKTKYRS